MTNCVWGSGGGGYEYDTCGCYGGATAKEIPASASFWRSNDDGDYSDELIVSYAVGGTATAGADHLLLGGSVTIAAGEWSVDVPYVYYTDTWPEPEEPGSAGSTCSRITALASKSSMSNHNSRES